MTAGMMTLSEYDYQRMQLELVSLRRRVRQLEEDNLILLQESENLRQGQFLVTARCENCGRVIKQPLHGGQRRRFCSNRCRTAQHRRGTRNF